MFAPRYFPARYYPPRYFGPGVAVETPAVQAPGKRRRPGVFPVRYRARPRWTLPRVAWEATWAIRQPVPVVEPAPAPAVLPRTIHAETTWRAPALAFTASVVPTLQAIRTIHTAAWQVPLWAVDAEGRMTVTIVLREGERAEFERRLAALRREITEMEESFALLLARRS